MPIVTYVRGRPTTLSVEQVKGRLASSPGGFEGLAAADRQYIDAAANGDREVRFEQITERLYFNPAHRVVLPLIGTSVEYKLQFNKSLKNAARVREAESQHQRYVETHPIVIEADYRIRIRPFAGAWQIGFVQTVDSLERTVRYAVRVHPPGRRLPDTELRTFISSPTRDAPASSVDTARPWFDRTAVHDITSDYTHDTVRLTDFPGMLIDWTHVSYDISLDARQSFTTYLVLRRSTGVGDALADAAGACLILARWRWSSWVKLVPPSQEPTGGYEIGEVDQLPDSANIPAIANSPVAKELLMTNQTERKVQSPQD